MEDTEILQILYSQNPWWEGKANVVPEQKREYFNSLKEKLAEKQIIAIIGPRRVGKSVLMEQLISDLLGQKVSPKEILFAQLDEPNFENEKGLLVSRILDVYFKHVLGKMPRDIDNRIFVFLDEIQKAGKWSEILKSHYDRNFKIKFLVSGSSSAGLTKGSSESLVGRVSLNYILPLKFSEFLKFKGMNADLENISLKLRAALKDSLEEGNPDLFWPILDKFSKNLAPIQQKTEALLGEYMIKGGYIELIWQNDYAKCAQYLKDLLQLVIYKDIVKVFGVRNPKNIEDLLLFLANHSAELFSESGTASKLGIKNQTVSEYMNYLEETFLISTSMLYAVNRAKQIRNPKKVFISDAGIRNMLNGTYSSKALADAKDVGLIAETLVHSHLLRFAGFLEQYNARCFYWKNGNEIDNVLTYSGKSVPFEVKFKNEIKAEDAKGCIDFIKENKAPFGFIITKKMLDFKDGLFYVPLWYFLLVC